MTESTSTIVRVIELIDTNKARMAFLVPLVLAVAGAVANWIATGEFDATEVRLAAGGAVLALGAGAGAYLAPAGDARVPIKPGDTLARRQSDKGERSSWGRSERGYADPLTLLVQLVVAVIVIVLLVWLVRELL